LKTPQKGDPLTYGGPDDLVLALDLLPDDLV
jgi:hypothetical protein